MLFFIYQLPISEPQKETLRSQERKIYRLNGGLIFLVYILAKTMDLNRDLATVLILSLFAATSIQLVSGSSRDLVTKIYLGLFVIFMACQYVLNLEKAFLVIFPAVISVFLFAAWRGRRDYVRGCSGDATN